MTKVTHGLVLTPERSCCATKVTHEFAFNCISGFITFRDTASRIKLINFMKKWRKDEPVKLEHISLSAVKFGQSAETHEDGWVLHFKYWLNPYSETSSKSTLVEALNAEAGALYQSLTDCMKRKFGNNYKNCALSAGTWRVVDDDRRI